MWSISARNITQAGQDATNRSKTSPKIIVVALAEVLRTPNKGNQYQIEVGQNTPPSKPWLESLTYFLAGVIIFRLFELCEQLQFVDALTNRDPDLMRIDDPGKFLATALAPDGFSNQVF